MLSHMASNSVAINSRRKTKEEVCNTYYALLYQKGLANVNAAGFYESLREHFDKLPTRYALDVNTESLDVLNHKRLLAEARADPSAVSFHVRPVEVPVGRHTSAFAGAMGHDEGIPVRGMARNTLPRPAFGSSPNLQALAIEANDNQEDGAVSPAADGKMFYEITVATADQPKLLSRLSEALNDVGLNIREAHAFNTTDGFSLDVFVADCWNAQNNESLEELLGQRFQEMPAPTPPVQRKPRADAPGAQPPVLAVPPEAPPTFTLDQGASQRRPASPVIDDWEIDISQLHIEAKVASGSFSNLYKGVYCGQDVAVKILKDVNESTSQYTEFLQEVAIMRKVRHRNVVQFIGACSRKPNLCIVFEFMSGGSVYDFIRKEGPLKLTTILKCALEVSRGMDYLHQRKIIHRDLKTANLLLDENQTLKIADFGVARFVEGDGHLTAETGTYRWMAPEVIEHKPYGSKADVFSFGVVLWELITCKLPYSDMSPLQAAVGVVQKGMRPPIPSNTPPALAQIMEACWDQEPQRRPSFKDLTVRLQALLDAAREEETRLRAAPSKGGLLSKLRGK